MVKDHVITLYKNKLHDEILFKELGLKLNRRRRGK